MNSTSAPETRLDAATALSSIEDQQNILHVRTDIRSAPLLAAWGLAWLLGYGALRLGRRPDFTVPAPHMAFFIATLVCAGLYTAVYISRRIRGIRGGSVDQGARLGAAWCGAFVLWFVIIGRIGSFLAAVDTIQAREVGVILSNAGPCLIVGVLFLASSAVWQERTLGVLGGWVLITTTAATIVGGSAMLLVMSLAGGGGMLLAAAWDARRSARSARSARPAVGAP